MGLLGTPLFACAACCQTFTTLANFNGANAAFPNAPLVQWTDGRLYGTTEQGGVEQAGTVFGIDAQGNLTTVSLFDGVYGLVNPHSGLVLATYGNFYGTTFSGGFSSYGTIFEGTPSTGFIPLYQFCPETPCADGSNPVTPLVQATNSNLYGTAPAGSDGFGGTALFELNSSNAFSVLVGCCEDQVGGNLIQALNGDLYGFGSIAGAALYGGIVKIALDGSYTSVYTFTGPPSGSRPCGGLVQSANGDFYGVTENGGSMAGSRGYGTVFRMTPAGALTVLHRFRGADGSYPCGPLVEATDGNFYGATLSGGTYNYGTIFKITPAGVLTSLHTFDLTDGESPGPLVQATDGNFYGVADGGDDGYGTAFTIATGLAPFVRTLPSAGAIGTTVTILGTNLTGATKVTFNGIPSAFTVNSSATAITTTVPQARPLARSRSRRRAPPYPATPLFVSRIRGARFIPRGASAPTWYDYIDAPTKLDGGVYEGAGRLRGFRRRAAWSEHPRSDARRSPRQSAGSHCHGPGCQP